MDKTEIRTLKPAEGELLTFSHMAPDALGELDPGKPVGRKPVFHQAHRIALDEDEIRQLTPSEEKMLCRRMEYAHEVLLLGLCEKPAIWGRVIRAESNSDKKQARALLRDYDRMDSEEAVAILHRVLEVADSEQGAGPQQLAAIITANPVSPRITHSLVAESKDPHVQKDFKRWRETVNEICQRLTLLAVKMTQTYGKGDFDERFSDAWMGLIRGVERHDYRRGRVSTSATHWISYTLCQEYYLKSSLVRRPKRRAQSTQPPQGSEKDASGALNNDESKRIVEFSLDAVITSEPDDHPSMDPAQSTEDHDLGQALHEKMARMLSPREQEVIRSIYGIQEQGGENDELPLRAVADSLGVSIARVHQIKTRAIQKLRTELAA